MIAIIYSSKYGTTEKICLTIKSLLPDTDSVHLIALEACGASVDISRFDTVILGTSIYAGQPRKGMVEFCKLHLAELLQKRLALIVCGMDRNNAVRETAAAYPQDLLSHAVGTTFFDGEFRLEKMHFADRMLLRVFFKVKESQTRDYDEDARSFVQAISNNQK